MVDYSKWKNIEISDDEDDTHPNIDTGSLFRWRHKARVEKMQEQQRTMQKLTQEERELEQKLAQLSVDVDDQDHDQQQAEQLRDQLKHVQEELAQMEKIQKKQPWNVDTLSQDGWSQTVLNKKCLLPQEEPAAQAEDLTDKTVDDYLSFVGKHEATIKKFAFLARFEDSRRFMMTNPELASKYTLDYLMLWCVQLKINSKLALFEHVARQAVTIEILLDLAKSTKNDPRSCIETFFDKAIKGMDRFTVVFEEELAGFKERIEEGVKKRVDSLMQEHEQHPEEDKVVGPGGLDPVEVFNSLPEEMQECFQTRDKNKLMEVVTTMDKEEAELHMKRCVDSGLWNPKCEEDADERLYHQIVEQDKDKIQYFANERSGEELGDDGDEP